LKKTAMQYGHIGRAQVPQGKEKENNEQGHSVISRHQLGEKRANRRDISIGRNIRKGNLTEGSLSLETSRVGLVL